MAKHRRRDRKFRLTCAAVVAFAACHPVAAMADTARAARPFVVGGDPASIRDYPYTVYLTDPNGNQFCGGALVGPSAVATAAHCAGAIDSASIRVVGGRQDKRSNDGTVARVSGVWIEPGFTDPGKGDDIAVLKLDRSMSYRQVNLPDGNDPALYGEGTKATVLGWGRTSDGGQRSLVLREAIVPVVSDASCANSFSVYDARSMVCAGYPQGGVDACQGDSGGPLVVGDTLIGLVSWGEGCAQPGKPGVYTRVSTYADEIKAHSGLRLLP
ncbi:MAG TPA: serine protease [Amycolatopsis sp.]|uniref:serine protease n=1 Tax=Amycolatopsis sp. TaxID=37632 RepID=UPI002B470E6D|nr:serine protease [Amycolatopsis sp.]HKS43914.1 serine protease [Amycolatopsis sp.]